jgi:hypothetical protein
MLYATSIQVGTCGDPECECVHIQLYDGNEEPIAIATIHIDLVRDLLKKIQDTAYEISTR